MVSKIIYSKSVSDGEVVMENEKSPGRKKKKSGGQGFVIYALFVFSALAVGLVVILMRSKGY